MPPSPASNAEIFFQSLFAPAADPFALLEALVTQKADENGWREFKEAAWYDATPPKDKAEASNREENLKAIWSESLSAFGNSGGGVLIWGISAPHREAKSTAIAQNAEVLANRLRELLINAVEPAVLGVEIRAVTRPNSKSGFVVCHTPPSAIGPHCGVWALGGYYVRGQDSNVRARPEILRRLFYPQTGPRLVPVVRLTVERGDNRCIHTAMGVNIQAFAMETSGVASSFRLEFAIEMTRTLLKFSCSGVRTSDQWLTTTGLAQRARPDSAHAHFCPHVGKRGRTYCRGGNADAGKLPESRAELGS